MDQGRRQVEALRTGMNNRGMMGTEISSEEEEATESRNHGKRICIIRKTKMIRASQVQLWRGES